MPITTTTSASTSASTSTSHKVTNGNDAAAACIPFVQIHTTDLQQQPEPERSYRNGFRRKTAEIKSEAELIKSELAEAAAKERINATPTPPTAKTISGDACTDLALATSACLHKCPSCPFLSLCQLKAQTHIASCFGVDAQQHLQCPGECKSVVTQFSVTNLICSSLQVVPMFSTTLTCSTCI